NRPNMSRSPQCTTWWSSTTRTRRLRSVIASVVLGSGEDERDVPMVGTVGPEGQGRPVLQGLEGGDAQAHARAPALRGTDAVVGDLQLHGIGVAADRHLDPPRRRVAPRVADRLAEHRL